MEEERLGRAIYNEGAIHTQQNESTELGMHGQHTSYANKYFDSSELGLIDLLSVAPAISLIRLRGVEFFSAAIY